MEIKDFKQAQKLSHLLNKKTYFTNPFFILNNCFETSGMVFENGLVDGKHPLLVYSDKYTDVSNNIIGTGFDEDILLIQQKYELLKKELLGLEFIYSSDEWISLEGSSFKDIRKNIAKFEKEHNVKVLDNYPLEKVTEFLSQWAEEKRKKSTSEFTKELFESELKESIDNLRLLKQIDCISIYIEENGNLIGFSVLFPYIDNLWVALMQKTKHNIRGLPQYLYHQKARMMGSHKIFTTGAEAQDPNLRKFKESLNPIEVKNIYTLFIGSKL